MALAGPRLMADDRGGREPVENGAPGQGGSKTSMTVAEAKAQEAGGHDTSTVDGAFLAENPYADAAASTLAWVGDVSGPDDPRLAGMLAKAQVEATLALAFEQRQTRFDLYVGLENHAQQTGPG